MGELVIAEKSKIVQVADAIRSKTGSAMGMTLDEMANAVHSISAGGGGSNSVSLQSKSVTPSEQKQIVTADSYYDGLRSVTVDAISSTYVGSEVTRKSAATYTPTTSDQTISSSQYLTGQQTIKGDSNLSSQNIRSGVSIFGVNGTYQGSTSLDTSDATAINSDIAKGKTAYVNGTKITGTHTCSSGLDTSDATATESDVRSGQTFYADGEKKTGTMGSWAGTVRDTSVSLSNGNFYVTFSIASSGYVQQGQYVRIKIDDPSIFGDATVEDVAEGKTFTSSQGLKLTGTASISGSGGDNTGEGSGSEGGSGGETETPEPTPTPTQCELALTNYGDADNCYIVINDVKYYEPQYVTVDFGTVVKLYSSGVYRGTIIVDGSTVSAGKPATYDLVVESNMIIDFEADSTMYTGITATTN